MHPQAVQLIPVLGDHARVSAEQALEHPGEISQVERVVRLGGRRQQVGGDAAVHRHRRLDNRVGERLHVLREVLRESPLEDRVEDYTINLLANIIFPYVQHSTMQIRNIVRSLPEEKRTSCPKRDSIIANCPLSCRLL